MPGPHPAVAATRCAARDALDGLADGALILVACSGGPDSLALAAAAALEAPRAGVRAGAVVVDHGLQPGSAAAASSAAAACRDLGLTPVEVVAVADGRPPPAPAAEARSVDAPRSPTPLVTTQPAADRNAAEPESGVSLRGGPEARARHARYAALARSARCHEANAVWLGHTLDDQAEQVLLGLCRGSGTRSLAGMARRRGIYVRPFLRLDRETTEAACAALELRPWLDATNSDPAFLRNRVRRALADLGADLGPGLAQALARSADLARQDADLLDALARDARQALGEQPWPVGTLAAHPPAIRGRLWRLLAAEAGAGSVSAAHVAALDALLTSWHGQGPVALPGGARAMRSGARVSMTPRGRQQWATAAPGVGRPGPRRQE